MGLAVFALSGAACSSGSAAPPGATVPNHILNQPPPSPYAVPTVITKAYVQSVLNALEAVQAQATLNITSHRSFTPAAATLIHSVTTESEYNFDYQAWQMVLSSGLQDVAAHPGAIVDTVQRVFPSSSTCIFVSLTRNFAAVSTVPSPARLSYAILRYGATEPNPTPWLVDRLGYNPQGPQPDDVCNQ